MRVLTYNILNGGVGRERAIEEVLRFHRADVVILQEIGGQAFVQTLARSLSMECFVALGTKPWARAHQRIAVLSRHKIVAAAVHGWFASGVVEVTIQYAPQEQVRVVGVHPAPFPSLVFELWRAWELRGAIAHALRNAPTHCLVVGDFNAIAPGDDVRLERFPWYLKLMTLAQGNHVPRFAMRQMGDAGFVDCFRTTAPQDAGYTVPTPAPNARIDYIFANASMALRIERCFVARDPAAVDVASDHYPVVADFNP
jgi:exonuclease III